MKKVLTAILIASLCLGFAAVTSFASETTKKWTFMVFLNADNDLDEFGAIDISEMERAAVSPNVNIVVQIDRMNKPARRYLASSREAKADDWGLKSKLVENIGEVDMGDYKELIKFVKWSSENYPAENYMLVVWNHGAGWKKRSERFALKGISYDDQSNNHITTKNLGAALSAIHGILGKPLDVFGMDACLMQMIEVAYELKDNARFIVASEETEPGDGWPYELVLAPLAQDASISSESLARLIPQAYFQSYLNAHDEPSDSPYSARKAQALRVKSTTLSAIDCRLIDEFASALDALSSKLIEAISSDKDEIKALASAVASAQKFYYYDNIDIGDFVYYVRERVKNADVKEAASKLLMIYKKLVIENRTTGDAKRDASGLAIYFPMKDFDDSYLKLGFANTSYDEMVKLLLASNPIFEDESDSDAGDDDKK